MILKPCPFCRKDIPRAITVCPYCHRDEQGKPVVMDSTVKATPGFERLTDMDIQELSSSDAFVREQSVHRISQRGFEVVPQLMSLLSDCTRPGLAGVAQALGKISDQRAIPILTQAIKMGDEELRYAAVWALAQFHDPQVLPLLLTEAERPHPIIQSYLAHVLGTFQDDKVLPTLGRLTSHTNREVAFQAVCALGELGNRQAIPVLKKTWHRRDPLVRAATAASLRRFGEKASRFSLKLIWSGIGLVCLLTAGIGWLIYR